MSVCLMVSNPISKEEDAFYVPIATEQVFQEFWMPIVEMLDLQWVKCFQGGIEVGKEDFRSILKELEEIKLWIGKNMNNERGKQMIKRLDNLSKELTLLLENARESVKVYIG